MRLFRQYRTVGISIIVLLDSEGASVILSVQQENDFSGTVAGSGRQGTDRYGDIRFAGPGGGRNGNPFRFVFDAPGRSGFSTQDKGAAFFRIQCPVQPAADREIPMGCDTLKLVPTRGIRIVIDT